MSFVPACEKLSDQSFGIYLDRKIHSIVYTSAHADLMVIH